MITRKKTKQNEGCEKYWKVKTVWDWPSLPMNRLAVWEDGWVQLPLIRRNLRGAHRDGAAFSVVGANIPAYHFMKKCIFVLISLLAILNCCVFYGFSLFDWFLSEFYVYINGREGAQTSLYASGLESCTWDQDWTIPARLRSFRGALAEYSIIFICSKYFEWFCDSTSMSPFSFCICDMMMGR